MSTVLGVTMAGGFMAALGGALAWMLAVASKRLYVYEDPRIEEVERLLPHSNCGACGSAGCRNFAEELVAGHVQPARCTVNTREVNEDIAAFLGVDMGNVEKRVARLACAGGRHVARMRAHYEGMASCRAATTVAGGGKACDWGCLGLGDCAAACDFGAISMSPSGLPVVDASKCTACGDCVEICPKALFSLEPMSRKLWIACKNRAEGGIAETLCEVACTACGRCVADSAPGLIRLDGDIAVIDYGKNALATQKSIERCPTGAIVWMEDGKATRGKSAKKIVRIQALPVASEI